MKSLFCSHNITLLRFKTVCRARIDLGFLIEGSSSVVRSGRKNFQRIKLFVKELIRRFTISTRETRIGAVVFSSRAQLVLRFSTSARIVNRAVNRIKYLRGGRNIGQALRYVGRYLYKGKSRCGRRRVLILITSGTSQDRVGRPAKVLHAEGVELYTVAVGKVSLRNLLRIATDTKHVLVTGYRGLMTIVRTLKDRICHSPGNSESIKK